jgi:hypothetical protein
MVLRIFGGIALEADLTQIKLRVSFRERLDGLSEFCHRTEQETGRRGSRI